MYTICINSYSALQTQFKPEYVFADDEGMYFELSFSGDVPELSIDAVGINAWQEEKRLFISRGEELSGTISVNDGVNYQTFRIDWVIVDDITINGNKRTGYERYC